jgi:hypothetical protein
MKLGARFFQVHRMAVGHRAIQRGRFDLTHLLSYAPEAYSQARVDVPYAIVMISWALTAREIFDLPVQRTSPSGEKLVQSGGLPWNASL